LRRLAIRVATFERPPGNPITSTLLSYTALSIRTMMEAWIVPLVNCWSAVMKANFLGMAAALALVSCCAVETAQASPIDVSYSVSGSPGEWLLDFTVTNNLDQFGGPGQLIYLFAVALPSTDISMSPPNWAYAENVGYGGPVYNNAWCINACGNVDLTLAIHTGQTLTGFQASQSRPYFCLPLTEDGARFAKQQHCLSIVTLNNADHVKLNNADL
jgi:hypothetical protein